MGPREVRKVVVKHTIDFLKFKQGLADRGWTIKYGCWQIPSNKSNAEIDKDWWDSTVEAIICRSENEK